jgi:tetratricopeptide (TPR) repeat protein
VTGWPPLAAATLASLLVAAIAPTRAQTPGAREALIVPFEMSGTPPHLFWLSEGSAWLIADSLERYGAAAITRAERVAAFDRLQLPSAATLSHATMIKVAQAVGANEVIVGSCAVNGDELTVRVQRISVDAGRISPELVEQGPIADLVGVFDRAARRLAGATSAAPPPLSGSLLASPQAFEAFIKGLVAEAPLTQRAFLEQAAKAAPADDRIALALWQVHMDLGDPARAFQIVSRVGDASLHARAARYRAAVALIDLERYDQAFDTLTALMAGGRSADVLNALGIVQLRRGGSPQSGSATYFFTQASQAASAEADYFFNLGYAYWLDRDPQAAIYWLREAVRRDPGDADAHLVLAAALRQGGAAAEAAREHQLAMRLSARYEASAAKGSIEVPSGLERLSDHLDRRADRLVASIVTTGQRDQAEVAAFHLDAGRRAFAREADTEAERELRRAIYLSPYQGEAHLLLGRLHLRNGRTAEAIQALKIALWCEDTPAGHVAMAEALIQAHDAAGAREAIDRALALDPGSVEARALANKLAGIRPKR